MPTDYYALAEQIAGGWGRWVARGEWRVASEAGEGRGGGVASLRPKALPDAYAAKANALVVRHASNHRVVAILEIVSPGNKSSRQALTAFVTKAIDILHAGVHLLIVDLFPPGPRDPEGIHKAIWDELLENDFELPVDSAVDAGELYRRRLS